ncbi:hypothetical protein TNCV_2093511 [Trichonephila clavipes]|nr:hypothetical protein TNCV_2093511 [Trichonephila clavipes]
MQISVIKGSSPHPTDDRLQQMVCATLSHCELALAEGRNDRSWCVAVSRQVSLKYAHTSNALCETTHTAVPQTGCVVYEATYVCVCSTEGRLSAYRLPGPYPCLYPRRRVPGIRFRRPVRQGTPRLNPPLRERLGLVRMKAEQCCILRSNVIPVKVWTKNSLVNVGDSGLSMSCSSTLNLVKIMTPVVNCLLEYVTTTRTAYRNAKHAEEKKIT